MNQKKCKTIRKEMRRDGETSRKIYQQIKNVVRKGGK